MTLTVNPPRNEYISTGSQTVFTFDFKIYSDQDLNVYITPAGQTPSDATDITTDYVIDAGSIETEGGGHLTMNAGVTAGYAVTIVSDIAQNRTTDYQVNGDFIPDTVNNDIDRSVSLVKQSFDRSNRSPAFQNSVQNAENTTMEAPLPGAFLAWDPTGKIIINAEGSSIPGLDTAVAEAEAAAAASQVSADNSSTSADDSSTSADDAATSEANAAASAAAAFNSGQYFTGSGPADAYILDSFPSSVDPLTLNDRDIYRTTFSADNTGACTVDFSLILGEIAGTTVLDVKLVGGVIDPAAGSIGAGQNTTLIYRTAPSAHVELARPSRQYVDVTGSRSLATPETNTTGGEIFVTIVMVDSSGGSGEVKGELTCTSPTGTHVVSKTQILDNGAFGAMGTLSAIIPDGATYEVTTSSGDTIQTWVELRT